MQKAQERDAARNNRFHFRRNVFPRERPHTPYDMHSRPVSPPGTGSSSRARSRQSSVPSPVDPTSNGINGANGTHRPQERSHSRTSTRCSSPDEEVAGCEVVQMTLDEVINGRGDSFPGLMGVVNAYLNSLNVDVGTKCELRRYLDLIKLRAKGESGAEGDGSGADIQAS